MSQAQVMAEELGAIQQDEAWLKQETQRLGKRTVLPLSHVVALHDWLDGKRKARQSCRIVGESRTGKTVSCQSYVFRNKVKQEKGRGPTMPILYLQPPAKCSAKDLYQEIIKALGHKATRGTTADLRARSMEVLQACRVEMLILDEADRLKPETFADIRDLYDKLSISIVLSGTDRLDTVIRRDEQVFNRFRPCHRFGKLTGDNFKATIALWEQEVLKLPVPSNLATSTSILKLLVQGTDGFIGRLDEILREAAIRALNTGKSCIDRETLEAVVQEYC